MLQQALILSSHRDYAQAMKQGLLRLGDSRTRVDVEVDPVRVMQSAPQPYEMILLDISFESLNGLQLMQLLKQSNPACSFVMVSDSGDESQRARAYRAGADLFLERPKSPRTIDLAVVSIASLLQEDSRDMTSDDAIESSAASLADIVQMRCLSGDSVLLLVRGPSQNGDIFIFRGEIFHALCPGKSGEAAFRDMMLWDAQHVRVRAARLATVPPRTIETSYRDLLKAATPSATNATTDHRGELYVVQGDASAPPEARNAMQEAPPLDATPAPAFPDLRPHVKGETLLPRVNSHWRVNLSGELLEGSQVADPDRCAFITSFIYRKMADVAVTLEVDYFDHMVLLGPHLQQVLVADNLGVRHAVFDAPWTTEEMRAQYVKWSCEQSF